MSTTDGLSAGQEVWDTQSEISVPVGKATLGRVFNVTGDLIDGEKHFQKIQKEDLFMLSRQVLLIKIQQLKCSKQELKLSIFVSFH